LYLSHVFSPFQVSVKQHLLWPALKHCSWFVLCTCGRCCFHLCKFKLSF